MNTEAVVQPKAWKLPDLTQSAQNTERLDRRMFLRQFAMFSGAAAVGATTASGIHFLLQPPAHVCETQDEKIRRVVEKVSPSVCTVEGPHGLGSGFIVRNHEGHAFVLTNAHVTEGNAGQGGRSGDPVYFIKMWNGRDDEEPLSFRAPPVVLASGERAHTYLDTGADLSLLQMPVNVPLPREAQGIAVRDIDGDPLRVGEAVVAVGSPFGARDHVTHGIISHVHRAWESEPQHVFIMTDAPINPGNSGGPLVDMKGRLVGVNTWKFRGGDGVAGAIRADAVIAILERWGVWVVRA